MRKLGVAIVLAICGGAALAAEDWPEIRGKGRLGVWTETGIVERFPADGLKVLWRTPVKAGLRGPGGRQRTRLRDRLRRDEAPARHRARAGARREDGKDSLDAGVGGRLPRHVVRTRPARDADGRRRSRLLRGRRRQAVLPERRHRRGRLEEGLRRRLRRRPREMGMGLGVLERAARRRRAPDRARRRPARRQGRRVRQADGQGAVARAVVRVGARRRAADHHQRRRHAAADHLVSRRGRVARSRRPAKCIGSSRTRSARR